MLRIIIDIILVCKYLNFYTAGIFTEWIFKAVLQLIRHI